MKTNDFRAAMEAFLKNNPDLPEGETVEEKPAERVKTDFRMDVVLEKKGRAGKQATIICGFQGSDDDLLELASTLKRRLATGGSARGGEILIQGDRRKEVVEILKSLGYKARII
ncbi:MAG: translation initiation factor [Bacteroides sp.]|nr:translation initiation factor [Bacteroides sp.]